MSEGELYKKIRTLPDGRYINIDSAFIRVGQVDDVLDEAKADFPRLKLPHDPERYVADIFIKLNLQREIWFEKWFGESL